MTGVSPAPPLSPQPGPGQGTHPPPPHWPVPKQGTPLQLSLPHGQDQDREEGQVRMGGWGTPRYLTPPPPPARSGWGEGYPKVPTPLPGQSRYPPPPVKDLVHGGQYASCVHSGGLSSFFERSVSTRIGDITPCKFQPTFCL